MRDEETGEERCSAVCTLQSALQFGGRRGRQMLIFRSREFSSRALLLRGKKVKPPL
jgi:hypothetical protein